jgi:cytochrome P450
VSPLVPPRIVPPAKPLAGLRFARTFLRNPLEVVPQAAYEEDFVPFGGTRSPRAWITSPALVKAVLLDQRDMFCKRTQIRLLGPLLGSGILTSEGAEWKWQRQAAAPVFRPESLETFVPAFVRAAEARLAEWRRSGDGTTQRIDVEMTRATFDVIAATLLPSSDSKLPADIHKSVAMLAQAGGWDLLFASLNLPTWIPHPGMGSSARAMMTLRSRVAAVVRERRAGAADTTADLTRRLIDARDPETSQAMSDERLVDNVLTFYLAGHETTAKALTWTLYLLARSREWSDAVAEEVERVAGREPLTAAHAEKLVIAQQVVKEAMRLYPPVPIMSRQALADVELEGHTVRARTSMLIPIYAVHRHERRWSEPHAFRPERFSAENEAAIPRYQYMPFGAGPRVCIGRAFAMLEATTMLATFIREARFEAIEGAEPVPVARVTLLPRDGLPLKVRWRRLV